MKYLIIIQKKIEYLLLFLLIKSYLHGTHLPYFYEYEKVVSLGSCRFFFTIHLGVLFLLIALKRYLPERKKNVFIFSKPTWNDVYETFLEKHLLLLSRMDIRFITVH